MNDKELDILVDEIKTKTDELQKLINKAIENGLRIDLDIHHWNYNRLHLSIFKSLFVPE